MKFKTLFVVYLISLLILPATMVFAAPSTQEITCEETYVVQADDWLSKLADRYYGDIFAYPAIVGATNLMATSDESFTNIANPDVIEIGQTLCIPGADAVEALVTAYEEGAPVTGVPVTVEPKLVWVDSVTVQMVDGEYQAALVGNYPDGCSTLGEVETAVDGDTISVTVLADSPSDVACTMSLVPFEETVALDLSEVEPGDYSIVVNETATTTLTVN